MREREEELLLPVAVVAEAVVQDVDASSSFSSKGANDTLHLLLLQGEEEEQEDREQVAKKGKNSVVSTTTSTSGDEIILEKIRKILSGVVGNINKKTEEQEGEQQTKVVKGHNSSFEEVSSTRRPIIGPPDKLEDAAEKLKEILERGKAADAARAAGTLLAAPAEKKLKDTEISAKVEKAARAAGAQHLVLPAEKVKEILALAPREKLKEVLAKEKAKKKAAIVARQKEKIKEILARGFPGRGDSRSPPLPPQELLRPESSSDKAAKKNISDLLAPPTVYNVGTEQVLEPVPASRDVPSSNKPPPPPRPEQYKLLGSKPPRPPLPEYKLDRLAPICVRPTVGRELDTPAKSIALKTENVNQLGAEQFLAKLGMHLENLYLYLNRERNAQKDTVIIDRIRSTMAAPRRTSPRMTAAKEIPTPISTSTDKAKEPAQPSSKAEPPTQTLLSAATKNTISDSRRAKEPAYPNMKAGPAPLVVSANAAKMKTPISDTGGVKPPYPNKAGPPTVATASAAKKSPILVEPGSAKDPAYSNKVAGPSTTEDDRCDDDDAKSIKSSSSRRSGRFSDSGFSDSKSISPLDDGKLTAFTKSKSTIPVTTGSAMKSSACPKINQAGAPTVVSAARTTANKKSTNHDTGSGRAKVANPKAAGVLFGKRAAPVTTNKSQPPGNKQVRKERPKRASLGQGPSCPRTGLVFYPGAIKRKDPPSPYQNEVSDAGFAYTNNICLAGEECSPILSLSRVALA
ncbi:unnamed protein product [Amoebophrya sp. A120]|nr:unnamed protein product [Amoebophrya sp. A120]|eukprot:GSA120T00023275001.1